MRKGMGWILAVLLSLAAAGCVRMSIVKKQYEKNPSLPQVEGELRLPGLHGPVKIYRDKFGVPHIFTNDEHDLFFAAGYVQAQDRLWEMVFLRALSEGRLCELFGDLGVPGRELMGMPLSTFGIDRRQRIMGMKWLGQVGEALLAKADPEMFDRLAAFCAGVNAYIREHDEWRELPIEFQALRVKPEPFRIADMMSLNVFIGSMLSGNLEVELLRYGLCKKYGDELCWKLVPLHDQPGPTIVPKEILKNRLDKPRDLPPGGRPSDEELGFSPAALDGNAALDLMLAEHAIKTAIYVDHPYASNNWIVSPKLTETKTAMLCNDPHLAHVEPSLFYMMHLKGAGYDAFGVTFPGNPLIVLGHTRRLAWGATTTAADVQDLFIETVDKDHPGKYKYKGEWRPFTVREEVIRIKVPGGFIKRKIKIKQSIHGPIINRIAGDLPKDTPPLALRWVAWDFNRDLSQFEKLITSATLEEFFAKFQEGELERQEVMSAAHMFTRLMKGSSIQDFIAAVDKLVLPNQSWVGADADGHIIYLPGGLVPVRKKGLGVMPVPGESGEFDWKGFIPLMELPHAIDPDRGYMATANNEVVDAEWYPYVFATNYGSGWRAWRIEELIKELAPLSKEDMKRIQNDVQVKEAAWLVPKVLAAVEHKKPQDPAALRAAEEFRNWDYEADLDSTATVIFFVFKKELQRLTLEDEMSEKDYRAYLAGRGQAITMWIERGGSEFFDDKRTPEKEDMEDIMVRALASAMKKVEEKYGKDPKNREWGKLHVIKWFSLLGFGPLKDLSVGPYPHLGAEGTVRNAGHAGFGKNPWKAMGGPVLRHIIDLSDPDHAWMIIDGSQSGQWLSPHYKDLHPLYVNSEYIETEMRPDKVEKEAERLLVLKPR